MVKNVQPSTTAEQQSSMQALQQYGGYIVSAILVVLAGYFGWQYWQNHGGRVDQQAADDFAKIQNDQNNLDTLATSATDNKATQTQLASAQASMNQDLTAFVAKHDNSIYTWQALMLQAKQQVDKNDFKAAATTLQKASQLTLKDDGLIALATLRHAQVLLADNQAAAAQKILQANVPTAFEASKLEILGDIANHNQDKKAAADYYQKAWVLVETRNNNQPIKQDRAILRLKMENLGLTVKQPDLSGGILAQPTANPAAAPTASATASP